MLISAVMSGIYDLTIRQNQLKLTSWSTFNAQNWSIDTLWQYKFF